MRVVAVFAERFVVVPLDVVVGAVAVPVPVPALVLVLVLGLVVELVELVVVEGRS